jgi:hypothetical protein
MNAARVRYLYVFYVFLLLLAAGGGLVQVALKDDAPHWSTWDEPR